MYFKSLTVTKVKTHCIIIFWNTVDINTFVLLHISDELKCYKGGMVWNMMKAVFLE